MKGQENKMIKKQILSLLTLLTIAVFFQNCGQSPLGFLDFNHGESDSASSTPPEENVVTVPYALLSAEQVFKSMASVTGTAPDGTIMGEYNNRSSVLGVGNDLNLVTSPMMLGVTNLASTFCNGTIGREAGQTVDLRKLFSQVDFGKPIANVNDSVFQSTVERIGKSFWGRSPSSEESAALAEAKTEFVSALTDNEKSQANSTRNLMLFTCTAMLSSFDSISF
jgi:hypothetical protein